MKIPKEIMYKNMIQMLSLRPFCDFTFKDTKKLKIFSRCRTYNFLSASSC